MADYLDISNLGEAGVNTDLSPLHKANNQFLKAQNVINDPLGVQKGLKNRPGLTPFNEETLDGAVLGGISVPLQNIFTGNPFLYLGRSPKS